MSDDDELLPVVMSAEEILRRAYKWFGVAAPTKYTFKMRDDYVTTMKAYSEWIREDKAENPDWWEEWNATLGRYFS